MAIVFGREEYGRDNSGHDTLVIAKEHKVHTANDSYGNVEFGPSKTVKLLHPGCVASTSAGLAL